MNLRLTLLITALAALMPSAEAQQARYVSEHEVPRPIDVARALAGNGFQPHLRKRGLSIDAPSPAANSEPPSALAAAASNAAPTGAESAPASPPGAGLDVAIGFALGSADLRPQAQTQLDAIAEGLKLLDPGAVIVIDGHTDATGSAAFNEVLSQRRAETVKAYLEQHHQLSGERLKTRGFGPREPIQGSKRP